MSPSKPSSPRSFSVSITGESVAGSLHPVTAGAAMCAAMTMGTPAAMPARKGIISQLSICFQFFAVAAKSVCVSARVSPWPGKCLMQPVIPASDRPCT